MHEFLLHYHFMFKYFLYLIAIIGFLWVNKIFVTDPTLRAWTLSAFQENNHANSKLIAAFICVIAVVIGFFIAIHFAPNHTAPEYYLYTIAALIGGVYGIKEMGKVYQKKYSNGNGNGSNGDDSGANGNGSNGNGIGDTLTGSSGANGNPNQSQAAQKP